MLKPLRSLPGFDEVAFLAAHANAPVISVRLHPFKGKSVDMGVDAVPWCSQGRYLASRPIFTLDPLFHGGAYYVQEASSMFLDYLFRQLLPDRTNLRVLDLCAAPGGKSTLLASLLESDSLLISNEVIRSRASILEENVARWGYMNTWVTSNDPVVFGKLPGFFDVVVVDAPCSGSGLFRKDPEALEEWSEANVTLCSQRQKRIIADVWPSLKEGGLLIYATCSYSPEEDEHITRWMVESFQATHVQVDVPDEWGIVTAGDAQGAGSGYRFFPDKARGEGFFIAAIQKTEPTTTAKPTKLKYKEDSVVQKQLTDFLVSEIDFVSIPLPDQQYAAVRRAHLSDFFQLKDHVYFRRVGLPAGQLMGKEWQPSHDMALSVDLSSNVAAIDVDLDTALRFLRKEDAGLAASPKGRYLIRYNGVALGWVKSLGNRYNNNLPKHWRIRMQ